MGAKPVGKIFLRRGKTTEGKEVFATMWKSKLGSCFYLTGHTRKYLNKDNQRSRIVFSEPVIKEGEETKNGVVLPKPVGHDRDAAGADYQTESTEFQEDEKAEKEGVVDTED